MELYQELHTPYGTMRGMLHKPDIEGKIPLVILFHGFTGNRIDSNFIFVSFSRFLAKHGIATLRFDFIGSGESDGEFSDMTFLRELEQANLVLDYAHTLKGFSHLTIAGFSMGGAVAAMLSSKRKDFDQLLLWSPAGNMANIAQSCFEQNRILDNGNVDLTGIELSREFYNELQSLDLYQHIEHFTKPVCIIHGSEDQAVPVLYGEKYQQGYPQADFHIIKGADHVYSSLNFRNQLFDYSLNFVKQKS